MEEKNTKNINEEKEGETKVSPLSLHNLYSHIKISVKTLDKIIIGLIIALAVIVIFAISNRGFTIEFDCQGGTSIEPIKRMYGETIGDLSTSREGYTFDYWASDQACNNKWSNDAEITNSIKLYACWIENK